MNEISHWPEAFAFQHGSKYLVLEREGNTTVLTSDISTIDNQRIDGETTAVYHQLHVRCQEISNAEKRILEYRFATSNNQMIIWAKSEKARNVFGNWDTIEENNGRLIATKKYYPRG